MFTKIGKNFEYYTILSEIRAMYRNGIGYILVSSFSFSLMNLCVKYLEDIPTHQIVFFRSVVTFIITASIIFYRGIPFFGNQINWLLVRGLAGATSLFLFFYTIKYMPIASAVTIQQLSPIFTLLLAVTFLGEKIKSLQWILFAIAFGGAVMVKGFDPRVSWFMLLLGILSAFFAGVAYNAIIKCKHTEHPLTLVMYFPMVALPITGIWCFFEWQNPNVSEWIILILSGLFTQIGQVTMTKALITGKPSVIVPFKYLGIVYALIYGFFLFSESFTPIVLLGIGLIVFSVITNAFVGK
jgi:drug/metabolite transporter (DMT)-like permease